MKKGMCRIEMARTGYTYIRAIYDSEGETVAYDQISRDDAIFLVGEYSGSVIGTQQMDFSEEQSAEWIWRAEIESLPENMAKDPLALFLQLGGFSYSSNRKMAGFSSGTNAAKFSAYFPDWQVWVVDGGNEYDGNKYEVEG